ncbi:M16 family metallopeptidase [Kangiella taiwanensis]|uniref:Pitrilysin family protein n=1 Tax=Kangiella taiwanensis TaxID=1079179 RepID=A0ABP8I7C0_9GAMM|nr:pitrilysin family protein [Kangiella taiwanensis]
MTKIITRSLVALAVSSAFLLTACQNSDKAETSITEPPVEAIDFSIPYERYTLDNGLTVILHQDKSDPIVALATVFHVGSSREEPGKTGFAHFFEHMAFNNSENVPMGANRKMIGELGGTRNGGTWNDGTIYYEVVPKDAFEKLLWIDSDRMGYMINTVTKDALEREKQVVKNEKRQRVDNRPYGHTGSVISSNLYPEDHPYNWSVIGSLEDLQNATLEDVKKFYAKYYGPNNATLVIAGDIEFDETKELVEKWFGEIGKGQPVLDLEPRPVELEQTISLSHEDNFAKLPEVRMVFPTVEEYHKDSYALNALGEILAQGKRAPLYKVIVEEKKLAPGASAYNSSREIAGEFTIRVRANAGTDLDLVKAAIEEALAKFETEGFSEKDLLQIKARQETQFYNGISSVLNKAFNLASYNEFAGSPDFLKQDIASIKAVTKQDIIDVYNKYIKGQHYVMTSFVPKGQLKLAVDGSKDAGVVEEKIVQGAEKDIVVKDEGDYPKTKTSFPRNEPPLGKTPLLTPPQVWDHQLDNGLRVLGIEQNELPLVQFTLRIEGGHYLERPEKSGVAYILSELMMEGTRDKTPEELEDAIGLLGAGINVEAGDEDITISANTLARNYDKTLSLVEEILLEPRFDPAEFERIKKRLLTRLKQQEGDAPAIASTVSRKMLYGDEHILGIPASGTIETVSAITLDDVKAFYNKNVSPTVSAFHVAGDISQSEVIRSLQRLTTSWDAKQVEWPEYKAKTADEQSQLYFIDVPGAKQSVIIGGQLTFPGASGDYNNLVYANDRLGAGSSARLFQLLRIEKGYTYGAYSYILRRESMSALMAQTSVRANVTKESLDLLTNEIEQYKDTFTQDDFATTQNIVIKRQTREFETLGSLLGVLEDISRFDLPLDYLEHEQQELSNLELSDFKQTIQQYMNPKRMDYLVVGDAKTQLERLGELGLGKPIQLDIKGNQINN